MSNNDSTLASTTMQSSPIENADRSVDETSLNPGDTTTVEMTVELDEDEFSLGDMELVELKDSFSPAFGAVDKNEIRPQGGNGGPGPDDDEFYAVWNEEAFTYRVSYDVTIPTDSDLGSEYDISGTFEWGDQSESLPSETITVEETMPEETSVELRPSEASAAPGEDATFDVVVGGADDGIVGYALDLSLDDASVAEFSTYSLTNDVDNDRSSLSGDSVLLDADLAENHEAEPYITIATVTVSGIENGTAELSTDNADIVSTENTSYSLASLDGATLTVEEVAGICAYTDESGVVGFSGLNDVIADWRTGEVGFTMLNDVISAWRSGEPVSECE